MSTAQLVPETRELDGDDAAATLRHARFGRLLLDSVKRFRSADGFSHARSLAFATLITILPGIIAIVGLATVLGIESFSEAVEDLIEDLAPGASGEILTDALGQGRSSLSHSVLPMAFGLIAMGFSGVTAFGQIERGSNRIYGIEMDRPFRDKYGKALRMFLLSLAIVTVIFVVFGIFHGAHLFGPRWFRWTIRTAAGVGFAAAFFAYVFQRSPRRRQPDLSWLVVGSGIATLLWVLSTAALGLFWQLGDTFGDTYGPLAGVMAMCLWCYVIAIGLYLGLSFAAQLEAVRAGRGNPQDPRKVAQSEPGSVVMSAGPVETVPDQIRVDGV